MMKIWMSGLLAAAITSLSVAADKKAGRADPLEISVPAEIQYEVRQYRHGEHLRAGQVGIAVAKKHLGKNETLPVVVFIHGGGWAKGDKDQLAWQCIRYAQKGYVAATLSYRLTHEVPFPTCIQDVMEAVRYIKSICPEIGGDPDNIGLQGYSAGAHLALMIALSSDDKGFHSGAYPDYDSTVKCAFVISAPTDFTERHKRGGPLKMFTDEQNEDPVFIKNISPVYHISADQIPILMVHGPADDLVPTYHYQNFKMRCDELGVENFRLIAEPEGGHMFFFKERKIYQPMMDDFFEEQLKTTTR